MRAIAVSRPNSQVIECPGLLCETSAKNSHVKIQIVRLVKLLRPELSLRDALAFVEGKTQILLQPEG